MPFLGEFIHDVPELLTPEIDKKSQPNSYDAISENVRCMLTSQHACQYHLQGGSTSSLISQWIVQFLVGTVMSCESLLCCAVLYDRRVIYSVLYIMTWFVL